MTSPSFMVRHIQPEDPDRLLALQIALGGPLAPSSVGSLPVAELLDGAREKKFSIDMLCGAYAADRLVSACVAVESAGHAALVLAPLEAGCPADMGGTAAALHTIQGVAWSSSVKLLEVLVSPDRDVAKACLAEGGFRRLTKLVYLQRATGLSATLGCATDLEWVSFTDDREPLFRSVLEQTYLESLDCPELTGMRSTGEVVAGHRSTGVFKPDWWWLATRCGQPVGVILLNEIRSADAAEVVYVGVAQVARGTGVANALLQKGVSVARSMRATSLTLAVDERNVPARRMYNRWGFDEILERDAWIASPAGV